MILEFKKVIVFFVIQVSSDASAVSVDSRQTVCDDGKVSQHRYNMHCGILITTWCTAKVDDSVYQPEM